MALSSKPETLVRMIDAFKTARYDSNSGVDAKYPWKDDHITWMHNVYELITSTAVKSQKRYTKILMDTLSMLFGICGLNVQSLRLAASETLNKIVKATYLTHITRIQLTAFNEMKKNGNVKSLKAALTLFSAICPHLQPLRCRPTIQSLAAVLVNIMKRNDEVLNECLREFLVNIFKVFACHLVEKDVQLLLEAFLSLLPSPSASTRRMTCSGIAAMVEFGRRPLTYGKWAIVRMLNLLAVDQIQNGTSCLLGVLQALRNLVPILFGLGRELEMAIPHTLYAFLLSCLLYEGDHNVVTSTLEVFQVILEYADKLPQFSQWLVTPSGEASLIEPFTSGSKLLASPRSPSSLERLSSRNASPLHRDADSGSEMSSLQDNYFSSSRESLDVLEGDDYGGEDQDEGDGFTPIAGVDDREDTVVIDVVGEEPTDFKKNVSPTAIPLSPLPARLHSTAPSATATANQHRHPNASFSVVAGAVISSEVLHPSAHKVSWQANLNLVITLSACFVVATDDGIPKDPQTKSQTKTTTTEERTTDAVCDGDLFSVPLVHFAQLLSSCFLLSSSSAGGGGGGGRAPVRVSVRSLALSCLVHAAALYPGALLCPGLPLGEGSKCCGPPPTEGGSVFGGRLLEVVKSYSDNSDPKLRGLVANIFGSYLQSSLRLSLGQYGRFVATWTSDSLKVEDLTGDMVALSNDESHLVLRAMCTAAGECLPLLFQSGLAEAALLLFNALLQLKKSTYWLVKVALVQLLSSVNYAHVCAAEYQVLGVGGAGQAQALETVFELLGTDDQRVRDIAAEGLARMVPNCCFEDSESSVLKQVAQIESTHQFPRSSHLNSTYPGSGSGCSQYRHIQSQIGHILDRMMSIVFTTANQHQMLGCISGLRQLALLYPPLLNPIAWKCANKQSHGWVSLLVPSLTSTWLTHNLQGHSELMEFLTLLITGVAMKDVRERPAEGQEFASLRTPRLAALMSDLFAHLMKVLNVFSHVIENRDSEQKLSKPFWDSSKSASSPAKPSSAAKEKQSDKSRKFSNIIRTDPTPKDVGLYKTQIHYAKLLDGVRAAYSNYQLNLDFEGSDKFSSLLSAVLNCISALLEVSTFQDIAKHTEEMMSYIHVTFQVDPRGSLLCTQQLLNALFGLNAAVHRLNIVSSTLYSPLEPFLFLSRTPDAHHLPGSLGGAHHPPPSASNTLYGRCLVEPFEHLVDRLASAMPPGAAQEARKRLRIEETDGLVSKSKPQRPPKIVLPKSPFKPANTVVQIQDYIKYFNQVIVVAMKEFPLTSSVLFQERVLFMLHQLLLLKVRYEPLDPHSNFLNAVLKHIDVLERGRAKDGEKLVPYIFQFLVLLSQDQTCKEISLPKVIQLCDTVMASGQSAMLFVLPALKPLVVNLFVHTPLSLLGDPKLLSALREMVIEKMLRLVIHHGTWNLFTVILESPSSEDLKPLLTRQVLAALLPPLAKLQLQLDSVEALASLQKLLVLIGAVIPEIQPLFTALSSVSSLNSVKDLYRWAGGLSAILRLVVVVANDDCLQLHLKSTKWTPPTLNIKELTLSSDKQPDEHKDSSVMFVRYVFAALKLLSVGLLRASCTPAQDPTDRSLLAHFAGDLLLMAQYLLHAGFYPKIYFCACSAIQQLESLTSTFQSLSVQWPLLSLHFFQLLSFLKSETVPQTVMMSVDVKCTSANQALVARVTNLIQLSHMLQDPMMLQNYLSIDTLLESRDEKPVVKLVKMAKKDLSLSEILIQKLSKLDWSSLSNTTRLHILQFLSEFVHNRELSPLVGTLLLDNFLIKGVPKSLVMQATRFMSKLLKIGLHLRPETKVKLCQQLRVLRLTNTELYALVGKDLSSVDGQSTMVADLASTPHSELVTLDWLISLARKLCSNEVLGNWGVPDLMRLFLIFDGESVMSLFTAPDFNEEVLEHCAHFVVEMSRVQPPERVGQFYWIPSTPPSSSPSNRVQILAKVIKAAYFDRVAMWCEGVRTSSVSVLVSIGLWIFSAQPMFPALTADEKSLAMKFCSELLKDVASSLESSNSPHLDSALQYLAKVLEDSSITSAVSEKHLNEWTLSVTHTLFSIVQSSLKPGLQLPEVIPDGAERITVSGNADDLLVRTDKAAQEITSLLEGLQTGLLSVGEDSSLPRTPKTCFHDNSLVHLKGVILGVSRLPLTYPYCIAPPSAYKMGWSGPDEGFIADDILIERDVLTQLNRQIGSIGWLKRQQFEELWMHYLTVLNQVTGPDSMETPEALEVAQITCHCVRGMTNLVVMSKLTPYSGNPVSSHQLHTHRHKDITFMGSRLGRKLSYLLCLLEDANQGTGNYVDSRFPPPCMLYSRNLDLLYPSHEPTRGQLSLVSLWPIMLVETVSPATDKGGDRSDVDPRSSVMFLLEQFTSWLSSSSSSGSTDKMPSIVKAEVVKSIVSISDVFSTSGQFDWMLVTFMEQLTVCSQDDVITFAALMYGLLKASAVCRIPPAVAETVVKHAEEALSSENTQIQISCLSGLLFPLEDSNSSIVPLIASSLCSYLVRHLTTETIQSYSQYHVIVMWSVAVALVESHFWQLKEVNEFTNKLLPVVYACLNQLSSNLSSDVLQAIGQGMERFALKGLLGKEDKRKLCTLSSKKIQEVAMGEVFCYVRLLLVCMYSGEAGEAISGVDTGNEETANLLIRECITALLERFRRSHKSQAGLVVQVLPTVLIDFLSPTDAISAVIHEILSPQQVHYTQCAELMAKVFELLIAIDQLPLISEWTLLSLNSFTQRTPVSLSLWSILCLLLASCASKELRAFLPTVARQPYKDIELRDDYMGILYKCCCYYYRHQCGTAEDKERFLSGFEGLSSHPVCKNILKLVNS